MGTSRMRVSARRLAVPVAVVVALFGACTTRAATRPAHHKLAAPPSAAEFARDLVGVTDGYTQQHHGDRRVTGAHCVEAARGRYMCAYSVVRAGATPECHLMQARWTPALASTFTVTLAGRTAKCGSVREAVSTLK
jgi:hypothetical protein